MWNIILSTGILGIIYKYYVILHILKHTEPKEMYSCFVLELVYNNTKIYFQVNLKINPEFKVVQQNN